MRPHTAALVLALFGCVAASAAALAVPPCSAATCLHGHCEAHGGSGNSTVCVCDAGWVGDTCAEAAPSWLTVAATWVASHAPPIFVGTAVGGVFLAGLIATAINVKHLQDGERKRAWTHHVYDPLLPPLPGVYVQPRLLSMGGGGGGEGGGGGDGGSARSGGASGGGSASGGSGGASVLSTSPNLLLASVSASPPSSLRGRALLLGGGEPRGGDARSGGVATSPGGGGAGGGGGGSLPSSLSSSGYHRPGSLSSMLGGGGASLAGGSGSLNAPVAVPGAARQRPSFSAGGSGAPASFGALSRSLGGDGGGSGVGTLGSSGPLSATSLPTSLASSLRTGATLVTAHGLAYSPTLLPHLASPPKRVRFGGQEERQFEKDGPLY